MGQGTGNRLVLREALLALLVLAIVFLNFGHVAPSLAGPNQFSAGVAFCGDPIHPGAPDHTPCHVCRIGGGADLPPPPVRAEPVVFMVAAVFYAAEIAPIVLAPIRPSASPRAPPTV